MREIKFRVWDRKNVKMEYPSMVDFHNSNSHTCYGCSNGYVDVGSSELMQFTGLTDKNGKKIYEKDLILGDGYGPYPVFWDDDHCGFCSCCYSDAEPISRYKTIEVTGNEFERDDTEC